MLFANVLAMLNICGEISGLGYTLQPADVRRTTDARLTPTRIGRVLSARGTGS
jgi:hypothetical protein